MNRLTIALLVVVAALGSLLSAGGPAGTPKSNGAAHDDAATPRPGSLNRR